MVTKWLLPFLGKMKSDESNKENSSEMDYLENATVIDESTLTPEQRLGLKQAEERLERDHIFRLEKVYYIVLVIWRKMHVQPSTALFIFLTVFLRQRYHSFSLPSLFFSPSLSLHLFSKSLHLWVFILSSQGLTNYGLSPCFCFQNCSKINTSCFYEQFYWNTAMSSLWSMAAFLLLWQSWVLNTWCSVFGSLSIKYLLFTKSIKYLLKYYFVPLQKVCWPLIYSFIK